VTSRSTHKGKHVVIIIDERHRSQFGDVKKKQRGVARLSAF